MSWFRVDDKSAFHRKVLKAGNEAWGAFCRAGAISAGEGTDGRVTLDTCLAIAPAKVWTRLVDAGLAERIEGSTDLLLHDYLQWNPSAAQVAASIEAKRRAGSKGGVSKARNHGSWLAAATAQATADAVAPAQQSPGIIPTQPNPSDPPLDPPLPAVVAVAPPREPPTPPQTLALPEPTKDAPQGKPAPRATRCPSSVDPAAKAWCEARGLPDPRLETELAKMLDHFAAKPGKDGTKLDWSATWRNWQRNASGFGRGPTRPVQPPAPRRADLADLPPGDWNERKVTHDPDGF